MLPKFIAVFFFLAMVHSTIYVSYAQFNGNEISIMIIEEEENSTSENTSKSAEKSFEYVFGHQITLTLSIYQKGDFNKDNCYYQKHSKGESIKRLPDNPPEV